eukprot:gene937-1818_t
MSLYFISRALTGVYVYRSRIVPDNNIVTSYNRNEINSSTTTNHVSDHTNNLITKGNTVVNTTTTSTTNMQNRTTENVSTFVISEANDDMNDVTPALFHMIDENFKYDDDGDKEVQAFQTSHLRTDESSFLSNVKLPLPLPPLPLPPLPLP